MEYNARTHSQLSGSVFVLSLSLSLSHHTLSSLYMHEFTRIESQKKQKLLKIFGRHGLRKVPNGASTPVGSCVLWMNPRVPPLAHSLIKGKTPTILTVLLGAVVTAVMVLVAIAQRLNDDTMPEMKTRIFVTIKI